MWRQIYRAVCEIFHPCFKIPLFGHFGWATITKITKITQFFNSLWHSPKVPWQHRFGFMSIPLTVSEEIAAQNFKKSTISPFWPFAGTKIDQIFSYRSIWLRTISRKPKIHRNFGFRLWCSFEQYFLWKTLLNQTNINSYYVKGPTKNAYKSRTLAERSES